MFIGVLLALASALATNAAFLFKQRGASAAPAVDGRHPLRSAAGLFRSRWWTRFFGFHLGHRQRIGLLITVTGLVVVGLTSGSPHTGRSSIGALIGVECGVLAAGGVLVLLSIKLDNTHRNEGMTLAVAAGALFGVSDVAVKYLAHSAHGGVLALVNPWLAAALIAMVISFYASARSLQLGPGLEVIALTSVAANIVAITGGILIFHDPIGSGPPQIVGRLLAFCCVIIGAGLMPAPTRARTGRRIRVHAGSAMPAAAVPGGRERRQDRA